LFFLSSYLSSNLFEKENIENNELFLYTTLVETSLLSECVSKDSTSNFLSDFTMDSNSGLVITTSNLYTNAPVFLSTLISICQVFLTR